MSTKPAAYPRQNRSPSFQNDTSPCSSAAPNDFFVSQKMDYIEHFLAKFDDRLAKLELSTKSPQEDRSFSSQKKLTENSEIDHKLRAVEDGLFFTKNETSKRLTNLEDHIRDLTRKATYGASRLPESREEQQTNVNEKIMSIERRVDGMDRRLEQLTNTLESFMQRIEGSLVASMRQQNQNGKREVRETREVREVRRHETEEPLTEVKLLGGTGSLKDTGYNRRFEETATAQVARRTSSRDVVPDARDSMREIPDQSGKRQYELKAQEKQLERSQRDRAERHEVRRTSDVRIPLEEPSEQPRHVERRPVDIRVQTRDQSRDSRDVREIKSGLKSPDTERKRKNVSWCETEGNVDTESPQKRSKGDSFYNESQLKVVEDEKISSGISGFSNRRVSLSDSLNDRERERPRSAIKARENPEERYRLEGGRGQRVPSASREEAVYEKYVRYPGDSRVEKLETTMEKTAGDNISTAENEKGTHNKERALEEKRKKIDEEIERRIGKQIELKKRADVAVEGQKKIYEKASQIEEDFKISPYSTEKSRDKEVVSRLVREKQMRNDLISKYSEHAPESSRKSSKSPLRK